MNLFNLVSKLCYYKISKEYSSFSLEKKFSDIRSYKVSDSVYKYLKSCFDNLLIEVTGKHKGNVMDLMESGLLEGWCWQTTESCILFLDDLSFIERGNLKFDNDYNYYHSWIVFKFKGISYVFDPCLNLLCERDIYHKIFNIVVVGSVNAKTVKEYFLNCFFDSNTDFDVTYGILKKFFSDSNEVYFSYCEEDVNAPMYRCGVGFKPTVVNDKVKKLVAHYYKIN